MRGMKERFRKQVFLFSFVQRPLCDCALFMSGDALTTNAWRPSPWAALLESLSTSQLACKRSPAVLRQTCLGACRNGGHEPITFMPRTASALMLSYTAFDTRASPLRGLARVLRYIIHSGAGKSCTFVLAGDSVSHDSFFAALSGALQLGLNLEGCVMPCRAERRSCGNATSASPLCSGGSPDSWHDSAVFSVSPANLAHLRAFAAAAQPGGADEGDAGAATVIADPSPCRRITLHHIPPEKLGRDLALVRALLGDGGAIMINEGLWANAAAELGRLLDQNVRPLLTALTSMKGERRARVLWRETTPQHFAGRSGTGLFAERSGTAATTGNVAVACTPLNSSNLNKANWRNRQFERWSQPWRLKPPSRHAHAAIHQRCGVPKVVRHALPKAEANALGRRLGDRAHKKTSTAAVGGHVDGASHHARSSATRGDSAANTSWGSALPRGARESLVEVVPAFAALAPRADLHVAPDCTHYCYTPYLWAPIWEAAADALERVTSGGNQELDCALRDK